MENRDDSIETPSSFIDKLTMEMFMNKKTYQKYIEKTEPKKHSEHQDFLSKMRKHGSSILRITHAYVEDPDKQVSLDMNRAFYEYAKICLRHFEDLELQDSGVGHKEELDEDVLFDPMKTGDSIDSFFMPNKKWGDH